MNRSAEINKRERGLIIARNFEKSIAISIVRRNKNKEEESSLPQENLIEFYRQQPNNYRHYQTPQKEHPIPIYQNYMQNAHISKIPIHAQKSPHKFSPQYASYIGAKPRAQASARVGLGGVF
jgi:hypothetical protein